MFNRWSTRARSRHQKGKLPAAERQWCVYSCQGITTLANCRKNLSGGERERERERKREGRQLDRWQYCSDLWVTIPYGGTPLAQITPFRVPLCRHDSPGRRGVREGEGYFVGLCRPRPPSPNMGKCRFDVGSREGATTFEFARILGLRRGRPALAARSNVVPRSSRFSVERVNGYVDFVTRVLRYFYSLNTCAL